MGNLNGDGGSKVYILILKNSKTDEMNQAIRSVRAQSPAILSRSTINLRSVTSSSSRLEKSQNMDQKSENDPKATTGDALSHSYGDGYATRSDEEGFGGTIGGNQSSLQMDKEIHENHPAYDKTQGSEVKEKEHARHQTKPSK